MARVTGLNTTRARGIGMLPLLCALFVFGSGALHAQTPPGTVIRNLATVTYQAATGATFAPVSDSTFVTVGSASGVAVTLVKSADRASGTMGDTVTYSVVYQGLGAATATNVIVSDVLPAGTVYVPSSITLHGAALTDVTGDDAGSFNAGSRRVSVTIPTVTGTDSGTVTFRAQLTGAVSPTNVARVDYLTPLGADSAFSNSIPTTLLFSSISVAKLLDAPVPAIARVGDAVQYRIRYDNPAAGVTARNVVVTDTLPQYLQYVTSNPPATVSGSVLTWSLGDIAAGTTADITVQTQVDAALPDSMTVVNGAALALDNGPSVNAVAPPVLLLLAGTGQITLAKVANVLEAGLGEAVPYTLTVQNLGTVALSGIQISDRLPEGGRYSTGSATGVDSVTANGRDVVFYVAGPVAPGALYRVHYQIAIVSTETSVLQNTAVASADAMGTPVQSQPATAWVRIRHAWPLETRAAIGRVFDDANHNGVQDNGEAGIAGVDVWTDDGEISTSDHEGRFSFQNLRPGRHVYRIDPATLPAGMNVPSSAQFVARDGSGWTSPRVNFALSAGGQEATAAVETAGGQESTAAVDTATVGNAGGQTATAAVGAAAVAADAPRAAVTAASSTAASSTVASSTVASSTVASSTVASSTVASPAAISWAGVSSPAAVPVADAFAGVSSPCGAFDDLIPGARGESAIVAYFNKNESRPFYVFPVPEIGARVAAMLEGRTGCTIRVVGHTDTSDVHGPPFWTNQELSDERARWVAYELRFGGLRNAIVDVIGHADREPLPGFGSGDLARNRRVELRLVYLAPTGPEAAAVVPVEPTPRPRGPNASPAAPLRDSVARADEQRRAALVLGPDVSVFAPKDGVILASDRVFVGVRGEPGATVVLFDGATPIADGQVRGDGVHDFIAVPLARGPHRLRVQMMNSWHQVRWDSLNVHVSGLPAQFVAESPRVTLAAASQRVDTLRVRVLDQWSVPVVTGALVTVTPEGAEVVNADADPSSVGMQVKADESGWLTLALRGGRDVRLGSLALRSGAAAARTQVEVLADARPFMMTATGQVGIGASPDAFGAATARGRLDDRTAVLVSIDSRQLDAGSDQFGRSVDPLADAQYPILGDASSVRSRNASRYAVAGRIERGLDWLAMGDLTTGGFAGGLALAGYDRALSGVAGRVTTGAVVWQGFGSTSSDRLAQLQIRGAGMSGPYDLGLGFKPGTERVALETRAYDNAQQVLARQVLVRYLDYQIDYEHGLLLFKQPVPATDPSGNPVFIMVTYGVDNGGVTSAVWGIRASADARGLLKRGGESLDSLRFGTTFIQDGRPGAQRQLASVDVGLLRTEHVALRGEVAHSSTSDSAGFAANIDGSVQLASGGVVLSAAWLHTDREFRNPANIALSGGASDLKLGARFAVGSGQLRLEHSSQQFDLQGVSRSRSGGFVAQQFGDLRAEAGVTASRLSTGTTNDANQATELKLVWSPLARFSFLADARLHLGDVASVNQPDYVGAGVRWKASRTTSFELNHRQVSIPNASGYAVTTLGGRSEVIPGTQAWGSYQISGASAEHAAAVVGLNNRLRINNAWTMNAMFERRMGLSNASTADPLRALPFTQVEENYWSAGLGAEFLPERAPYRLSLRSEIRDGDERSSKLLTAAGEASLSPAFALLSRQEFQSSDDRSTSGRVNHQRLSSLTGVAFRPVGSDQLNLLAKLQFIDEQNPLGGGVLTAQTGREARRIATVEAIYSPAARVELGARYAVRITEATVTHTDSVVQPLSSSANYLGGRLDVGFNRWVAVRADSRMLYEQTSATTRWDLAPQLVIMPASGIELAAGYRTGDLRDPDFAVRGGQGWFVTLGATLTEQSMASVAGFWRSRF